LLLLCLVAAVGVSGCDEGGVFGAGGDGGLLVQVVDSVGAGIPLVSVLTVPETRRAVTDERGEARLTGLDRGIYAVVATDSWLGTGRSSPVYVAGSGVTRIEVELQRGVYLVPKGTIYEPYWGVERLCGDTLVFRALVDDPGGPTAKLDLVWSGDLDGVLRRERGVHPGRYEFATAELSCTTQMVRLQVTNQAGVSDLDSMLVRVLPENPELRILQPADSSLFMLGEEIEFEALLDRVNSPLELLEYEWVSNLGGSFAAGHPDSGGEIRATTAELPPGLQWITLRVRRDGREIVRQRIKLVNGAPPEIEGFEGEAVMGRVSLRWSPSEAADFDRYEVWRAPEAEHAGEWIATIDAVTQDAFVDTLAPPVRRAFYRLRVYNDAGICRQSEALPVENPGGLVLPQMPRALLLHPSAPWAYLDGSSPDRVGRLGSFS
jgi:hypothetical protein